MTLTGPGLIALLAVIAVVAPVLGVLAWPRCRGGRLLATIQRVGILACCQLAALALGGALVNDYGYFYASWSQLRAAVAQAVDGPASSGPATGRYTSPSGPPTERAPEATTRTMPSELYPASAGRVDVHHGAGSPAQWAQRGRLDSVTILGAISGLHEHAFVYLPPQYFQPRYSATLFPGVEVMTGYPGSDLALVRRMRYPEVLADLQRTGRARPMVLVMLRPSVTFPRDTECTDVPDGPQALTFFAADVPAQVAHSYRVRPTGWGAVGDSTGGYCATKLAMTHPLIVTAAVSLSGYYFALHDDTTGDLWGGSPEIRNLNDLTWRMQHLPPPPVSLFIATSRTENGPDGYQQALSFVHVIRAPTVATLLVARQGGHNFHTWARELPAALSWMSARVAGP